MIKFFIIHRKTILLLSHPSLGPALAELLLVFFLFIRKFIYNFFFIWNIHPPLLFRSALMAPCVLRITSCYHSLYFQHRTRVSTLVIRCLSLFCSIIHHYRILSHNDLKFVTHIFQIFREVNANLKYGLRELGLFWFWKIVYRSLLLRNNWFNLYQTEKSDQYYLSFNICFDILYKILKSENENQASDYMIIGYCEPLVFNIHGY
jgi:hypothetical protein